MSDDPKVEPQDGTTPEPEGSTDEPVTMDDLREVRAEAKKWRLKLRDQEKKNEELAEKLAKFDKMEQTLKKLTGADPDTNGDMEAAIAQTQAEMQATKTQAKSALLKSAFIAKAAEKSIIDPHRVFRMIDSGDERLSVDLKTGEVDGIDEVVADLIKEAPYLIKTADGAAPPATGTPDIPAPGSQPPTAQTRPPDKKAALKAAFEECEEIGGVKGATEFERRKREINAEG